MANSFYRVENLLGFSKGTFHDEFNIGHFVVIIAIVSPLPQAVQAPCQMSSWRILSKMLSYLRMYLCSIITISDHKTIGHRKISGATKGRKISPADCAPLGGFSAKILVCQILSESGKKEVLTPIKSHCHFGEGGNPL